MQLEEQLYDKEMELKKIQAEQQRQNFEKKLEENKKKDGRWKMIDIVKSTLIHYGLIDFSL